MENGRAKFLLVLPPRHVEKFRVCLVTDAGEGDLREKLDKT